ncbi:hypothetical protein WME97_05425 [Sorangium sp. So ce367]|uniref:hypothetical protein n=1 Tax=Sorangium sp. So ce367 TaxID=3133305 RepID=UPI003F626928
MTVLRSPIHMAALPERLWVALDRLDALDEHDPGISKSEIQSEKREGLSAGRESARAG